MAPNIDCFVDIKLRQFPLECKHPSSSGEQFLAAFLVHHAERAVLERDGKDADGMISSVSSAVYISERQFKHRTRWS
ncbi:MAG: hypothetical protein RBU27_03520 [Bacteroidota bacterium]|nr:hypothetical protein [Bacteroidota bacterium]